ncbi:hypothetical protein [Catenovulum maritimum]|uniref:Uncharacterized protein n=1 Tax=Catenovulum maritimum TaxID=1513271 RepID=A0A0J8GS09_9ALTE|nr:hypothetical protein [Catenovulum maritimum]KMT65590.1 hypothetical protein XM47_07785 [Catenovulum maritimum]
MSDIQDGKLANAYRVALANAKRAAIEQAVGTIIESRTLVENFQMVSDQVLTSASGRLKSFQVIKEGKTPDNIYEVTIQAEADVDELIQEVDRFQKALKWQKKPRITVVIDNYSLDKSSVTAEQVKNFLIDHLQDDKFPVFDLGEKTQFRGGFVIHLNVEKQTSEIEYQNMKLKSNELAINARLSRADDAKIMATASGVKKLPGGNTSRASRKASKAIVKDIWKTLRKRLTTAWEEEQYATRGIQLKIESLESMEQAKEILKAMQSTLAGVKKAELSIFDKELSEFSIEYRGWPEQLVDELNSGVFKTRHFESEVQRVAGNQIVIKII